MTEARASANSTLRFEDRQQPGAVWTVGEDTGGIDSAIASTARGESHPNKPNTPSECLSVAGQTNSAARTPSLERSARARTRRVPRSRTECPTRHLVLSRVSTAPIGCHRVSQGGPRQWCPGRRWKEPKSGARCRRPCAHSGTRRRRSPMGRRGQVSSHARSANRTCHPMTAVRSMRSMSARRTPLGPSPVRTRQGRREREARR
jgi:hypothetical protein